MLSKGPSTVPSLGVTVQARSSRTVPREWHRHCGGSTRFTASRWPSMQTWVTTSPQHQYFGGDLTDQPEASARGESGRSATDGGGCHVPHNRGTTRIGMRWQHPSLSRAKPSMQSSVSNCVPPVGEKHGDGELGHGPANVQLAGLAWGIALPRRINNRAYRLH